MSALAGALAAAQLSAFQNYIANAGYQAAGSASMANAFVTACRILVGTLPKSGGQMGANMVLTPELVQQQLDDAQVWIASNPDSSVKPGGVGYFAFNNLR